MKKRTIVRIMSFFTAVIFVVAGFYIKSEQKVKTYKLQVQNTYSKALEDLSSGINNISILLEKSQYVTSASQISSIAAELFSEAELTKTALSQLPTGVEELTVLNRFLSQVGNYSLSISKSLISGGEITEQNFNELGLLTQTAKKISGVVNDSQINYNNHDYWATELDKKISEAVPEESLASSLTGLEENLTDYPTLIYDGPYSDHILTKESEMLKNAKEITKEQALTIAANTLGVTPQEITFQGMDNGRIVSYRFGNDSVAITVSKAGGYVIYMRKFRTIGDTSLNYNQALEKAKRFLNNSANIGMLETYYYTDEGICVINFAYLDGETICYTDLIKVGVAMDTGEIMLLECSGYVNNHVQRAFETPAITAEQAAGAVSKNLTINKTSVTLIPTDSGGEVRCYEFKCTGKNDEDILIYINVITLAEERVLVLLKSDGGTLVK